MRYRGKLGFRTQQRTTPGVWEDQVIEKVYRGNVTRTYRATDDRDRISAEFSANHTLSVVADDYALANLGSVVYAEWQGTKWVINSVEVNRPRLLLRLGGRYNGDPS